MIWKSRSTKEKKRYKKSIGNHLGRSLHIQSTWGLRNIWDLQEAVITSVLFFYEDECGFIDTKMMKMTKHLKRESLFLMQKKSLLLLTIPLLDCCELMIILKQRNLDEEWTWSYRDDSSLSMYEDTSKATPIWSNLIDCHQKLDLFFEWDFFFFTRGIYFIKRKCWIPIATVYIKILFREHLLYTQVKQSIMTMMRCSCIQT